MMMDLKFSLHPSIVCAVYCHVASRLSMLSVSLILWPRSELHGVVHGFLKLSIQICSV